MASSLNEESVEKKLKTVNNTQDSIQSLSLWIIHHKTNHDKIVELWLKVLKKTGRSFILKNKSLNLETLYETQQFAHVLPF